MRNSEPVDPTKALDEFFAVVREEAVRNPAFGARLLEAHATSLGYVSTYAMPLHIGAIAAFAVAAHLDHLRTERRAPPMDAAERGSPVATLTPYAALMLAGYALLVLHGGSFGELHPPWLVLAPGRSFPSRRPVAQLDRIVISGEWGLEGVHVHHSPLAARASDHLPVYARLMLPKK